jgi:uncharacterized protein YxeA
MKMIITLISTLFCVAYLSAQTHYYDVSRTFYENGYTYQCDVQRSKRVRLYNKDNELTYTKWVFKDNGKEPPFPYDIDDTKDDTWTKRKCYSIVNNAFSAEEKQRTRGEELDICIYIDSNTGKVIEVDFTFLATNSFATIPISVYRKIEIGLKENIWFTTTAEGKKMNYLVRTWRQKIGATLLPD